MGFQCCMVKQSKCMEEGENYGLSTPSPFRNSSFASSGGESIDTNLTECVISLSFRACVPGRGGLWIMSLYGHKITWPPPCYTFYLSQYQRSDAKKIGAADVSTGTSGRCCYNIKIPSFQIRALSIPQTLEGRN